MLIFSCVSLVTTKCNRFDLRDNYQDSSQNEDKLIDEVVNGGIQNNLPNHEKRFLQDKISKLEKTCEVQDKLIKKMMVKIGLAIESFVFTCSLLFTM
jgi:hypothetical protein